MFRNLKRIVIHPLLIYLVIASLECICYRVDKHPPVFYELPKVGDNFRVLNENALYYFSGKGKYAYPTAECYFSLGNPSFTADYKDGGIKVIDSVVASKIPMLGYLCSDQKMAPKGKLDQDAKKYLSTDFLLDNFSNVSHVVSYLLLAFSILYHYRSKKINYAVVFGLCFLGGGLLEFVQKFFIVGRSASLEDQSLNCVGAILGMLLFWIIKKTPYLK